MRGIAPTLSVACGLLGAGCATAKPAVVPEARFAQSEAAIQAAEEAGAATKNPSAAIHLRMAREENEEAKRNASHRATRVETMLIRSVVDADLAKALAVESQTREEARKARDEVRILEEKNDVP